MTEIPDGYFVSGEETRVGLAGQTYTVQLLSRLQPVESHVIAYQKHQEKRARRIEQLKRIAAKADRPSSLRWMAAHYGLLNGKSEPEIAAEIGCSERGVRGMATRWRTIESAIAELERIE